jgi:hypothetical protein
MPNSLPWSQGTVNLSIDTFARLPQVGTLEEVGVWVEIPFDAGATFDSAGVGKTPAARCRCACAGPARRSTSSRPRVLSCVGRGGVSIVPGNIERSYEVIERY